MNEQMLKLEFAYTDEFNQETRIAKTLTQAAFLDRSAFEMLLDEFKLFLLSIGFPDNYVSKIIIDD